ncbi:MAG: hypothetical protein ACTSWQ_08285, partial [Candidatus Thorarchaeota archaeon]
MAEQFLSRLNQIEDSINQLGETLKRMITILGSVTEMKSDIRVAKDEILQALANLPASAPTGAPAEDNTDEYAKMVVQEVGAVRVFVQEAVEAIKNDMRGLFSELDMKIDAVAAAPPPEPVAPAPAPALTPEPEPVAAAPEPVIHIEPAPAAPAVVSI